MDLWDEDNSRPKLLVQSRSTQSVQQQKQEEGRPLKTPLIILTVTISSVLLILTFFFIQTEPLKSLFIWFSLSLLLGPLAPSRLTAGSIRVGHGPLLTFPDPAKPETDTVRRRNPKPRNNDNVKIQKGYSKWDGGSSIVQENENVKRVDEEEEREWSDGDVELLKKQLVKHPVGKLRRWEVIAEAFNGRHRMESVIRKSKELGARKAGGDNDSYARFLKDRKPLDQRVESEGGDAGLSWSAGDDVALLNAVKAFPKDVTMRWEKVAAAVPGKTKADCVKRFADLKKDFRNSKKGVANE